MIKVFSCVNSPFAMSARMKKEERTAMCEECSITLKTKTKLLSLHSRWHL